MLGKIKIDREKTDYERANWIRLSHGRVHGWFSSVEPSGYQVISLATYLKGRDSRP
jgi:hypothetical protein